MAQKQCDTKAHKDTHRDWGRQQHRGWVAWWCGYQWGIHGGVTLGCLHPSAPPLPPAQTNLLPIPDQIVRGHSLTALALPAWVRAYHTASHTTCLCVRFSLAFPRILFLACLACPLSPLTVCVSDTCCGMQTSEVMSPVFVCLRSNSLSLSMGNSRRFGPERLEQHLTKQQPCG